MNSTGKVIKKYKNNKSYTKISHPKFGHDEHLIKDYIQVFVDGACINNGKSNAQAGFGIFWPHNKSLNVCQQIKDGNKTNNRGELLAILTAIKQGIDNKITNLVIYSDSEYSINCCITWVKKWIKNNWQTSVGKPVENKEEIQEIYRLLNSSECKNYKIHHVPAHVGIYGNEQADKLAKSSLNK